MAEILKRFEQHLPVALTIPEKLAKSVELGEALHALMLHKAAMKATATAQKEMRDELETTALCLARIVRDGKEDRPVECAEVAIPDAGVVRIVRLDSGEAVGQRTMSESERQQSLFPREVIENIATATGGEVKS